VRRLLWTAWRRRVKKLVEAADVIHAVSPREAKLIELHYPAARGKLAVIPNGVEEDVYAYRWRGAGSDYAIYAGRIERYKNIERAVDIANKLGLRLLVLGDGPHRGELARYIEKRQAKAELQPPQPRPRYLEMLTGARYAINMSQHEAYSIFTAEALATGTPAITSLTIAEIFTELGLAEAKPLKDAYLLTPIRPMPTWNDVTEKYLKLYRCV
jgi:glycosyltransferase involved in cell wall biosynthesis